MLRILLLSLAFISFRSYGQLWEPVVESETHVEYSYDPATLKWVGNIVTYWELSDYSTPLKAGNLTVKSTKSKVIQDCENNRFRVADLIDYDG